MLLQFLSFRKDNPTEAPSKYHTKTNPNPKLNTSEFLFVSKNVEIIKH